MVIISTEETLAIVLGGGRGSRLYPLTKERCKPAAPLGGKYRLIDVPISNCINSGLRKIYILTQFMSASLNKHVSRAYNMDVFTEGFVNVIAATQTEEGDKSWFQGTADAVRKCIALANVSNYKRVVILSGDQLYKMDFRKVLAAHDKNRADITVCVLPVEEEKVAGLGVMRIDDSGRIDEFYEKPEDPEIVDKYRVSEKFADEWGIEGKTKRWLASMGIYVFETPALIDILKDDSKVDFGKDVIPSSLSRFKTMSHLFNGYWEDIGTIKSFFDANILMGSPNPPFRFHGDDQSKIFTKQRFLTASRFMGTSISESVISDGCFFDENSTIQKSVIGIRSYVGKRVTIEEAIVMGADFYKRPPSERHLPPVGVGDGAVIRRAILDKNVSIGEGAKIINERGVEEEDGDCYHIRNGIVVIPKNAIVEAGRVI